MKWFVAWLAGLGSSLVFCGCFQYIWNTYVTLLGAISLGYWEAFGVSLLASWAGVLTMVIPQPTTNVQLKGTPLTRAYAALIVKVVAVLYLWAMAYAVSFFI